jgi:tetratricopeptide (TPR) repeat protein
MARRGGCTLSARLALVMIVRDEARCIARCLGSAMPWVDEAIVLDTGSRDATPQIAQARGAAVHHAAWPDDFAAARNAALAFTDAPWRLVLDADEWLEEGAGAVLREACAGEGRSIGLLRVTSQLDGAIGTDTPSWLPRLLPRGVRYAGRIHEQPVSALPRRRIAAGIVHDGYLAPQQQAKRGRNERLLRLELVAAPGDAYLHYQLGKDLELQGRFAEAGPHYARAAAGVSPGAAWRHDLVLRRLFTLKRTASFEAALALAEAEMPHWQHSPDFFFTLGDLLLDWALQAPQRAGELLPMIESSWLRALEIGEQPALNDSVRGRGSFLAAHNLAAFHASLGHAAQADEWSRQATELRAAVPGAAVAATA